MPAEPFTSAEWDALFNTIRSVLIAHYQHQKTIINQKLCSFDQLNWQGLKLKIQSDLPQELCDPRHTQTRMNYIIDWLENALCE